MSLSQNVTQSHDHMLQWNMIKGSERDNVTIIYLIHVDLMDNI